MTTGVKLSLLTITHKNKTLARSSVFNLIPGLIHVITTGNKALYKSCNLLIAVDKSIRSTGSMCFISWLIVKT